MKNLFKILGVHRNSTPEEIKEARRRKAYEFHPDRGAGADVGAMLEVNEAYTTLTDKDARRRYLILLGGAGHTCHKCEGQGRTKRQRGFTKAEYAICNECHGAGVIV